LAIYLAFKGAEYADDYWLTRPLWWLPLIVCLGIAAWLTGHALDFLTPADHRSEDVVVKSVTDDTAQATRQASTKAVRQAGLNPAARAIQRVP
jgi:hypothetical protein